ncbi:MAG: 2-oxoglutarate dehydrogenase complex dihydrolipoyllysine-residue succinyltransferase [Candidatus Rokuibacteriota bacterium]
MPVELRVPTSAESITEVLIADWFKAEGDRVRKDEPVVLLETDKAALELPSPVSGVLVKVLKPKGQMAKVGEVIAHLEEALVPEPPPAPAAGAVAEAPRVMPAARRLLGEHGVTAEQVTPTGPGGRLLKEDVLGYLEDAGPAAAAPAAAPEKEKAPAHEVAPRAAGAREEETVPMSLLRRRVAERLVQAQQTAALLTTFNEIDMSAVLALRRAHQEAFQRRYQVKLGIMSFFVKAAIEALKLIPGLNAEIRGTDVVYHNYYDIGIAVGGGRGLVVPVLRNAERLSFATIEQAIGDLARRARDNRLTPEELQGGTFTISNGGVYGSLLSTPIVNPPQSGILGLHVIQDRPVARDGQVVIRPMMYVALTYDHRIVDGREAVTFLRHVKGCIEEPARVLLEV